MKLEDNEKFFCLLDMYNSSTQGPAGAGSGGGANWNSWGLANSSSAGSSEYCRFNRSLSGVARATVNIHLVISNALVNVSDDMYNRQSGPGSASGPPGAMQPPSGPNAGNSKPPSDYPSAYGGYGESRFTNFRRIYSNVCLAQALRHPDIVNLWMYPSSSSSSSSLS